MKTTLRDLADLVGGQLRGNGDCEITGAAIIRNAQPGQITLVDRLPLVKKLHACQASAVVAPEGFPETPLPAVLVPDVHRAFSAVVSHFRPPRSSRWQGISPAAHVADSAHLAEGVTVFPGAFIGQDVRIGEGSIVHSGVRILDGCQIDREVTIFPNTVLYENTRVGARTIIHAGAVLGAYGFGYQTQQGQHQLCAQLGNVEIGADVEIGAGSTIDRGTYDATVIGDGTKIDDQVMIGHNCRIGRHNLICSQVGIAGSCRTGDYVVLAGQVGIGDHIDIGDGAKLGAKSGAMNDVEPQTVQVGIPCMPEKEYWRLWIAFKRLPEMQRFFKQLRRDGQSDAA